MATVGHGQGPTRRAARRRARAEEREPAVPRAHRPVRPVGGLQVVRRARRDHARPFPVNERTMPHVHDIVGQLFEPSRRNGPLLIDVLLDAVLFTAKEAAAGFLIGAMFGFAIAVVLSESRLLQRGFMPVHRRVADDADPGDRADGGHLGEPEAARVARRLGRRGRDLRLPDVLPGHDQHAARAPVSRPARGRVDALVCRRPLADPLEAPRSRVVAVPLHRTEDRGARGVVGAIIGELPRRSRSGLGGAILNFNQYYVSSPPSLWATNIIAAALGIASSWSSPSAEKLSSPRAPENVA